MEIGMNTLTLDELCEPAPAPSPADWNDTGVVIGRGVLTEQPMQQYEQCWRAHAPDVQGWAHCTPYLEHAELRRLLTQPVITKTIEQLIGEPPVLHLNLTGWVTTERDWHQDQYLNEPGVGDYYAAVWVALDTVHPDSGPFQYVPGSHRWPQVQRDRLKAALAPEERDTPQWPKHSERLLSPMFEREIAERDAEIVTYLPSRGDVLIWHGRLLHRGSKARVPGMERRAVIAHYSGLHHRGDMPNKAIEPDTGGWYAVLGVKTAVR